MKKRDLISIEDLSNREIEELFRLADGMPAGEREAKACAGKIMATLFYEPSTRTRLSFESAMQRLGGSVISCPDMRSSSTAKGESIADTARVVASYADVLVVRHCWDGAVQAMAEYAEVPVINAGDGSHEHPTQTLCDLYTLRKEKGDLKGLTVVICGDLKHGRTIHSLVYALARFGAHVVTLAANGMELPQYVIEKLEREYHYNLAPVASDDLHAVVQETDAIYLTPTQPHQLALFTSVDAEAQSRLSKMVSGIKVDAFYVTRKQKERMKPEGEAGNGGYPRIGEEFLKEKRFKDTVVMHPLPRVDELSQELDRDRRGIYFKQAAYGVPVRMALLKFLFEASATGKAGAAEKRIPLYESPEPAAPPCANANCVTRTEPVSTRPRFEVLFTGPGGGLILKCFYCDHQLKVQYMGHTRSRKYCPYDIALGETVRDWLGRGELAVFDSIKHAEERGYEPYKSGPQRSIMDEAEIRDAVRRMSEEILKESEEPDRLLILGIRTKGSYLAKRIAEELERKSQKRIEVGEIEIYGSGDDLRRLPSVDGEASAPSVKERAVILVDDVIHTGMTVKNALSIIFKSGRPSSVRLAVLVDRGHREMPVKPNYVGKHIPSSEKERVRVKLREVEQDERDKVVIYSIVSPEDGDQPPAIRTEL
ncbi:MAG: aspartate carbamoyltransferase [Deltaproteobacteria bacterium]|nr:aspartate carbamoyltransferase [Deltaproteobacteria bacterium]MBI2349819.1 aspartate carbamoyltransferase [Deltaproteobacteria bacterium]MBI2540573.1 aspartate carbamoyltransferase [Deltaproteobacteria bacterium]